LVRRVVVSTVEWTIIKPTLMENVEEALAMIDKAGLEEPDILCFPENFPSSGVPHKKALDIASPIPGPITDKIGEKARQYNMYVICPLTELDGETIYNTAALIDRKGKVIGKYHKIHPTIGEIESGITPGTEAKIFETDFGKIGIMICFDVYYPRVVENMVRKGAEIIFFPAAFAAQTYLIGMAWQYAVYIISSIRGPGSQIIDLTGRLIARGSYPQVPFTSAELNLDRKRFEEDFNIKKVPKIWKKYGRKVEINIFRPDGALVIASNSEAVRLDDIIKEFQLEPFTQYIQRSEEALNKAVRSS